jgi:hypothetical protein
LGNLASAEELYVTPEEAGKVGDAFREFAKHHAMGISEKRMSEINLVLAAGGVFVPKVIAIIRRPKKAGPVRVIREDRTAAPAAAPQPQAAAMPDIPLKSPQAAQVPSEMWPQPGDIIEEE